MEIGLDINFFKSNLINCIVFSGEQCNMLNNFCQFSDGHIGIGSNGIKRVGYLFCLYDCFSHSSVYKEIEYRLKKFGCDNVDSRIRESISIVGLDDEFLYSKTSRLDADGMFKLSLVSIIALNPDILIFNETDFLIDFRCKKSLVKVLRSLKNKYGKTIIIISHDVNFVHRFVDYVYLFKNGTLFCEGNKFDVLSNESIMNECCCFVPDILHFSNLVYSKKNIKIGYRDDINDLIKDVYRYAKW